MPDKGEVALDHYYEQILKTGRLPTPEHARRWSTAVLMALGNTLRGSTKRSLAKELPRELHSNLKGDFRLVRFWDPKLSAAEFRKRVALRGGNSDAEFGGLMATAVFGSLKRLLPADVAAKVAQELPPGVAALWDVAKNEPPGHRDGGTV
jgi:uncharacterized protein (DUF2267 family)